MAARVVGGGGGGDEVQGGSRGCLKEVAEDLGVRAQEGRPTGITGVTSAARGKRIEPTAWCDLGAGRSF